MKGDILLDAMEFIDEEAVRDARDCRRPKTRGWVKVCLVAAAVALLSTTALAAWHFLRPAQVAEERGNHTLSAAFDSEDAVEINASVTSGDYTFTLLAMVSGEGLTDFGVSGTFVQPGRTYAVVAVSNADGSPIREEQAFYLTNELLATPLVRGEKPWQLNIATLGGAAGDMLEDGVLYRLVEFNDVLMFAHRGVYLGVCDSPFLTQDAFLFDEATGDISVNPDYPGASALFELPLDPALGDPEAAEQYLARVYGELGFAEIEIETPVPDISPEEIADPAEEHPGLSPDARALLDRTRELWETTDWDSLVPLEGSCREIAVDANGYLSYEYPLGNGRNTAGFTVLAELIFERFAQGETAIRFRHVSGDGTDAAVWAERITQIDDHTVAVVVVVPEE